VRACTPSCLVQLKTASDTPRLLGFAIYIWTIPAPFVQIHIAISTTSEAKGPCAFSAKLDDRPVTLLGRRHAPCIA
jgi:hypothetical protein